jgi:16S rRNA (guanine966-N2)-methyltransferase
MRVITGEYKGRRINPVKGVDIRYTSDRVKESLFSIISGIIPDSKFLDICAGSGNVGIEAISRGAEFVTFVDINPECVKTLSSNLERCGIDSARFKIMRMEASLALDYFRRHESQFDIIFLDPPYCIGLAEKIVQGISKCNILADDGKAIVEHDVKEIVPLQVNSLAMKRQEKYGTTVLSFYEIKDCNR